VTPAAGGDEVEGAVEEGALAAGRFSEWRAELAAVLRGERGADVPCAGCTACCRSSQFVHIEPDEAEALARIPSQLVFPAPRRPAGHVLMGYDEEGRCPMLVDDACSIYEHRPRTCRAYDCRVFAAAGVDPDPATQPAIAQRVRRWRFDEVDDTDRAEHDAVRAAAAYVREHPDRLPDSAGPTTPLQHALLALELSEGFIGRDAPQGP
jgi:Fe-S-cluster containining protein